MAISCVYCGGRHETSTEVRQCWSSGRSAPEPAALPATQPATSRAGGEAVHVSLRALPELGRNLVVLPGPPTPAAWSATRRLAIDDSDLGDPAPLIAELTHLAATRESCVFEIDASIDPALSALQTNTNALHVVGPRFTFEL